MAQGLHKRRARFRLGLLWCCLLAASTTVGMNCYAQSEEQQSERQARMSAEISVDDGNRVGAPLLKNLWSDQKMIWTSPRRLRWADGTWLFPFVAASAGFFATDRAVLAALPDDPKKIARYNNLSNYGLVSLVGGGGGFYFWGRISHDEHRRETGVLAGEAAFDGLAVSSALQYSFGRERPYQDAGRASFFKRGTSFPSDHATVSWSIASVIAHEYPGPLTQVLAYGAATAVSAARVMGREHFPSDVFVGGAIGWLIGREVYRTHHDPELPGNVVGALSSGEDEGHDRRDMGSPFVPLDHWAYPAIEKLAALGFIHSAILGLKPWTRMECARLVDEASEALQKQSSGEPGVDGQENVAAALEVRLDEEFAYELARLGGGHNQTLNLESAYVRVVSISGPALADSDHFGQTVAYDFGRPFERGTNGQAGGSFSAAAGPLVLYARAEYQHAPAAPAPSDTMLAIMAGSDRVPLSEVPSGAAIPGVDRPELLEAYAGVNIHNWQLSLGRQSLSWAPGSDSMLWSDNIRPVNMVRLVNPEPFVLPGLLRHLGPVRIDQFFGRLDGHPYVRRPFEYGQKINVKLFSFLELGFGRTVTIGGTNTGTLCSVQRVCADPLTAGNLLDSFAGIATGGTAAAVGSVPGDNHSEMDWTFYVPRVRHYIVLYGDAYADDDILPIENPARNPLHPGLYLTRFPGIPKLDFHIEGVSTEQAGLIAAAGGGNHGQFNYWNQSYPDGYTSGGELIGNATGRDGRTIQCWLTYAITPRQTVQAAYKHNSIAADFIPGGAAWQDYALRDEIYLRNGFYAKAELQYEDISRYPALFRGPQANVTAIVEVGFRPPKSAGLQGNTP